MRHGLWVLIYDLVREASSGDKKRKSNIYAAAHGALGFEYMETVFSAQYIKNRFSRRCKGSVKRYISRNQQGMYGCNWELEDALEKDSADAQGKIFAEHFLRSTVLVPADVLAEAHGFESQQQYIEWHAANERLAAA